MLNIRTSRKSARARKAVPRLTKVRIGYPEISGVRTHPAYRGKGLAASLIWQLARNHRRDGLVSWLHVGEANRNAIELYLRMGFKAVRKVILNRITRKDEASNETSDPLGRNRSPTKNSHLLAQQIQQLKLKRPPSKTSSKNSPRLGGAERFFIRPAVGRRIDISCSQQMPKSYLALFVNT